MFDNTDSDSGTMVSKDSRSGTMMVKDSPSGTMMVKDSGTMMVKDSGTMMVKDSPTGTMVRKDNGTMVNKSDSPSGTVVLHGNATFTGGALAAAAAAMRPSAGVGQSVAPSAPNPEVRVRCVNIVRVCMLDAFRVVRVRALICCSSPSSLTPRCKRRSKSCSQRWRTRSRRSKSATAT